MIFYIYRDRKREWRWRLRARNGRIVATSGEGYLRKRDCVDGMELVISEIQSGNFRRDESCL